jgi:cytochrome c-type biogenesis protein CcmE
MMLTAILCSCSRTVRQDDPGSVCQTKPSNFEQAVSIVAIGHYDASRGVFLADDLLVKCPSKYQEMQAAAQ